MDTAAPPPVHASAYVEGSLRLDGPGDAACEPLALRCCGFIARNRRWNYPQVFSPFWRLYHNFAPGHRIRHAGRTIPLAPGRVVLVPENVLFHCESPGGVPGHLYIHFNLPAGWTPRLREPRAVPVDEPLRRLARELARAIPRADPRAGHLASALVHWTLGRLHDGNAMTVAPAPGVRAALAHIAGHLPDDLTNPGLARVAGMSVRAFVRAFHEQTGETPQNHVRASRLREAARRLAHGGDSIEQIADALGFANRYYFTRRFTREIGSTPAAFRRMMQGRLRRVS